MRPWSPPARTVAWSLGVLLALAVPSRADAVSFKECSTGPYANFLTTLTLGTGSAPIPFGEAVRVRTRAELHEHLAVPPDYTVVVEHWVDGRKLPCLGPYLGSCTYEDVIAGMPAGCVVQAGATPAWSCGGPKASGTYNVDDAFMLHGDGSMLFGTNVLSVRLEHGQTGRVLGCVEVTLDVVRCDALFPPCTGPDCEPHFCIGSGGWGEEVCGNGLDDDGDGSVDEQAVAPGVEAYCHDGFDDDCDGLADPYDTDCVGRGSVYVEPSFTGAASCDDAGIDTLLLTVDDGTSVREEAYACHDDGFFFSAAPGAVSITVAGTSDAGAWSSPPVGVTLTAGQSHTEAVALTCAACP